MHEQAVALHRNMRTNKRWLGWHLFVLAMLAAGSWLLTLPAWHSTIDRRVDILITFVMLCSVAYLPHFLSYHQQSLFLLASVVMLVVFLPFRPFLLIHYLPLTVALLASVGLRHRASGQTLTIREACHILKNTQAREGKFTVSPKRKDQGVPPVDKLE